MEPPFDQKMQAVTRTHYGGPDVLDITTLPTPVPKDNEVLIKVYATTVNRTDCGILLGKPYLIRLFTGLVKPRHLVPGTDFSGRIVALGKKVTSFAIGDRVWGLGDEGVCSHAQLMTFRADKAIAKIPEGIGYPEAAAAAEGAHYAFNFLNKINLKPDHKVLVNGATGAIGSAAVQLLHYYGAQVTAVGNTKNIALLASLGADRTIDYCKEDFTKESGKYHFIIDAVGKSSFPTCKHLLMPKGIYMSSELGPYAQNLYLPLITWFKGLVPRKLNGKKVIFPIPTQCKRSILFISKLMVAGKFNPVIDTTYSLDQIKEAYTYVLSGQKTGNVIISYKSPMS